MSLFDKLFRRKPSHEEWLAAHPGKGRVTMDAPAISEADQAATRARMEDELQRQAHQNDPK